ncbi:hypothetical protein POM88_031843 [Heracleum sosnowskyi]|uniref:Uncharacterized protein n=1 Tax=Heracleum sosnowskyi TaxID=360622 RepID=A0AAD8HZ00_9APIA|nr:hypothetical protein POM88_031843 [Heracleum sosnowskyi]
MAQDTVAQHVPLNPCCQLLQKKESKLSQKLSKSEEGRNFLKKAIAILQDKITKFEGENRKLSEELEQERKRAEDKGDKKIEDPASRVTLENEISALRSEISSLKQSCSSGSEHEGEKVVILQARVSEGEKEINFLKGNLEKERIRAENERKVAEVQPEEANEALKEAKEEMVRAEKLQADHEREMKIKESTIRVPLEYEISSLKSQIEALSQQAVSGAQDVSKEAILLQQSVHEQKAEITQLKELLQKEKDRANSETKKAEEERKKADEEKNRVEIVWAENERALKVKELAVQVSLEDEISILKSQITLLQKQAVLGAQDVNKEIIVLQERISDKETEINRLNELLYIEKHRADSERKKSEQKGNEVDEKEAWAEKLLAEHEREMELKEAAVRLPLENEISSLTSQIELLQQQVVSGGQDVSKNTQAQDLNKTTVLSQEHLSERETEINLLKMLLKEEKNRADSEKKKADKAKCRAETVLADNERSLKEKEQAIRIGLGDEISALKSQIHLLQQEIAVKDDKKEASIFQSLVSEKEAEINQLQRLVDKERTRAESEKKKAESCKKKVNESQKIAMTQKSRADEESRLASIERKKVEEARIQLERLRAEVSDLRANTEADALRFKQANEKLEIVTQKVMKEIQRADMEMAKTEEQSKLLETMRREIVEEKDRADCLGQQLKAERGRLKKLHDKIAEHASSSNAGKGPGDLVEDMDLEAVKLQNSPQLEVTNKESGASKPVLKCLQCEEITKKLEGVKQKAKREKERADSEMRKAEYQKKVAEAYGEKDRVNTSRCEQMAQELEDGRCETEELKKEIHELVSSRTLVKMVDNKNGKSETTRMKLLKKELKLERMQAKHAKQVASLEKDRNILLRQEICRIKEEFSRISDHLDILDKCSSHRDVGLNKPEKNCNAFRRQGTKRKFLDDELCQVLILNRTLEESEERGALFVGKLNKSAEWTENLQLVDVQGGKCECIEESGDALLKLLDLDNPSDEESYRAAIERPLSPTLPEIGSVSGRALVKDNNGQINVVSPISDIMFPSCCPNEEIKIKNGEMGHLSDSGNLSLLCTGHEELNVSSGSNCQPACSPSYYVIFSDIVSNKSISKIFSATRTCLAQCSILSQIDCLVQMTLSTVVKIKDLLPREMVCVFFSLLLQNFPEFALDNFKRVIDVGVVLSESFAQQVHSVIGDLERRCIFENELLSLIEDFMIHRRVLLYCNVSSESLHVHDPIGDIVIGGGDILSFRAASDQQLLGSSVILASICVAVDHIGFVCGTSYNMLRMRKMDSSMLAILHVFAYIAGAKYFTNSDHSLSMTVMKSLVTVLEREISSTETSYCRPSSVLHLGFPPYKDCPYSVGALPMDAVVSLLTGKLHNYVLTNVSNENRNKKPSSDDGKIFCVQRGNCDVPGCHHKAGLSISPDTVSCKTLFDLGEILSLLELVAANMNWSWSFTNIVLKLLEILDSCFIDKLTPAVIVLLGQLGRLGVVAKGYNDTGVETLRDRLSSFLHQNGSAIMVLPTQIATVYALLGVIPLRFEELIKSNNKPPEVVEDSGSTDRVRNWFSLLSKEQQSLSTKLLIDGVASW